ncbi:MAG: ectonucleotide pyrophosphatase/phosphodiesterase [Acidobacteriota bacterium]
MNRRRLQSAKCRLLSLLLLALIIFNLLSIATNYSANAQSAIASAHVVVISIDGLMPDYYLNSTQIGIKLPTLTQMKLNGAYAEGVEGVYPSVTYPAHTTLITGVKPATHGIVQNRIFEAPDAPQTKEWYWFANAVKTETLWSMAKKAGLKTAAIGWPVTVNAEIDYNVPEIFDPKENPPTGKRTLQYATPGLLQNALVAGKEMTTDGRRTAVSEYIIKNYQPDLLLVHLVESDDAQHKHGPRSPEALATIERLDGYVGRIIEATKQAGVFEKTTFFIVSDHGFAKINQKFFPNVVLAKAKLITVDSNGKVADWQAAAWPAGGACPIVLRDTNDQESAKKVQELFSKYLTRTHSPLSRLVSVADAKRLGAVPQATVILEAAPGFSFDEALTGDEVQSSGATYKGTHGYLPSRPEMYASLIIYGANVRVGAKLALAKMIDIAPTAAACLGLSFEKAEGRPLADLVKPAILPKPQTDKKKKAKA